MSTQQVLNWLAFGRAVHGDCTLGQLIQKDWRHAPWHGEHFLSTLHAPLLHIFCDLAGDRVQPCACDPEWPFSPEMTCSLFEEARCILAQKSLAPKDAAALYGGLLIAYQARQSAFESAETMLWQHLISGKISLCATPVDGNGRISAPASVLQAEVFGTAGILLMPDGNIVLRQAMEKRVLYIGAYFLTSTVAEVWPYPGAVEARSAPSPAIRTGVSGRPTSRHLIEAEMRRRAATGQMQEKIAAEARALSVWLGEKHPEFPQMKPKSISAALLPLHQELSGKRRKSSADG